MEEGRGGGRLPQPRSPTVNETLVARLGAVAGRTRETTLPEQSDGRALPWDSGAVEDLAMWQSEKYRKMEFWFLVVGTFIGWGLLTLILSCGA